jgi:hypothetical protein
MEIKKNNNKQVPICSVGSTAPSDTRGVMMEPRNEQGQTQKKTDKSTKRKV